MIKFMTFVATCGGAGYAPVAFLLFLVFDVFKPFPASWVDHHVHGGLGVIGDDIVSGLFVGAGTRLLFSLF